MIMESGMFKKLCLIGALLSVSVSNSAIADIAIVVNKKMDIKSIDINEVRDLYLGERRAFPNGIHAVPINHTEGSPDRKEFFSEVLNMDEGAVERRWKRKMAVSTYYEPEEVGSYKELLKTIANTPGSIGYIDASEVNDSVKVLLTIPSTGDV
jgi:ABC-type phosphate transport system substrate-binding protein